MGKFFGHDNPFDVYITPLANDRFEGEWVSFPTTPDAIRDIFQRLDIGPSQWSIANVNCHIDSITDVIQECTDLDELNYLAVKLEQLGEHEFDQFCAVLEINEHNDSMEELINLCDNLECYEFTPEIYDEEDLGRNRVRDRNTFDQHTVDILSDYIDFEEFGEDIAREEEGKFANNCYVVPSGISFTEYYRGEIGDVPEAYMVTGKIIVPELSDDDRLDRSIELAIDLDNFFRQQDPDYAARCPNDQQQKEAIADDLFAGKIMAIEQRLTELGVEEHDYLFQELAGYKDAIRYDPAADLPPEPKKMTVLMVEPGKVPYIKEIEPGLRSLQEQVGGFIEAVYPYEDLVALICNEEGKLMGMELNRALRDENGHIYDIMAGPFMVVGLGEEDFTSLPDDLLQKFEGKFKHPEVFLQMGSKIVVCKQPIPEEVKRPVKEQLKDAAQKAAERPVTGIRTPEPER